MQTCPLKVFPNEYIHSFQIIKKNMISYFEVTDRTTLLKSLVEYNLLTKESFQTWECHKI